MTLRFLRENLAVGPCKLQACERATIALAPDPRLLHAEPKAIAEHGFQFLLLDTYSQLWLLLQQYITNAQNKSCMLLHVLSSLQVLFASVSNRTQPLLVLHALTSCHCLCSGAS